MKVFFQNSCRKNVILSLNQDKTIISPRCCVTIDVPCVSNLEFAVKSETFDAFYKGKYVLNIETTYNFEDIKKEGTFVITCEKVRINHNAYFERLFVTSDSKKCVSQSYKILEEEKIKRRFTRRKLLRFLFVEPFECLTGLSVGLIGIGALLTYLFGWRCAIVYFPLSYVMLLIINWLSEKVNSFVFKKAFNEQDEVSEFYSLFYNDFIDAYYSNPGREAYMGEVEVE